MKTKTFIVVVVLSLVIITQAYSFGLGVQANFSAAEDVFETGAALLYSPTEVVNFAANWFIDPENKYNSLGFTLDVCPIPLPSPEPKFFSMTLGFGFFWWAVLFEDAKGNSDIEYDGGIRIPLGARVLLIQNTLELFAHIAPSWEVTFTPNMHFEKPFCSFALGARVWIRSS